MSYDHQWMYREHEREPGNTVYCYDCKRAYVTFPDMMIPDDLWERINPSEHKGGGVLCPTCIARRLDHLGLWYRVKFIFEAER